MNKHEKWLAAILLIIVIMLFASTKNWMLSIGYIVGTQGLQAEFNSIHYKNYWYDKNNPGPNPYYQDNVASACEFFDRVNFDPDEPDGRHPNLKASMQPILVDTEVEPKLYMWQIKKGSTTEGNIIYDVYEQFEMRRYRCEWAVNLWLDGPEEESWGDVNQRYTDLQLWIKLVPQNFLYFKDNPDEVYFAPAYFGLDEKAFWGYYDENGRYFEDSAMGDFQDIFPEAEGETLGIFYEKGGQEIDIEDTLLSYQNKSLDPRVFRSEYWIRIGVDRFYTVSWLDYGVWHRWHQPSVLLKFLVYVYAVGKWTVKLAVGEVQDLTPHQSQFTQGGWGGWAWFANPMNQLWIFFFTLVVVVIVVSIFSPGVWTVLARALGRRRET